MNDIGNGLLRDFFGSEPVATVSVMSSR